MGEKTRAFSHNYRHHKPPLRGGRIHFTTWATTKDRLDGVHATNAANDVGIPTRRFNRDFFRSGNIVAAAQRQQRCRRQETFVGEDRVRANYRAVRKLEPLNFNI